MKSIALHCRDKRESVYFGASLRGDRHSPQLCTRRVGVLASIIKKQIVLPAQQSVLPETAAAIPLEERVTGYHRLCLLRRHTLGQLLPSQRVCDQTVPPSTEQLLQAVNFS